MAPIASARCWRVVRKHCISKAAGPCSATSATVCSSVEASLVVRAAFRMALHTTATSCPRTTIGVQSGHWCAFSTRCTRRQRSLQLDAPQPSLLFRSSLPALLYRLFTEHNLCLGQSQKESAAHEDLTISIPRQRKRLADSESRTEAKDSPTTPHKGAWLVRSTKRETPSRTR